MLQKTAILLTLLLTGCSVASPTAPGDQPDVEGLIIGLLPDHRALVEATFRAGRYPDTFYVNSGPTVRIRQADGSFRETPKSELRVGDHLRAWLTGVELRSLPPQYPARVVEVYRSAR